MDENKIIIINLSKGRVGEANANLLGSMLITKIYLAAMSRADVSERELQKLPNFYLYVDEFQSFANESFADILSEARKYKLNLTIAHQYIEQMSEEVRAAVFGNVGTMITFRVGAFDAEVLEKEFAPQFTAEDLVNLGMFQIYLKLMIDGASSTPFSATTTPPIKEPERSFRAEVVDMSRKQFAMNRAEVEQEVIDWHKDKGVVTVAKPVSRDFLSKKEDKIIPKSVLTPTPTSQLVIDKKIETKIVSPIKAPVVNQNPSSVIEKKNIPPPRVFDQPKYIKRDETRPPMPIKPDDLPDDDFIPLKDLKVKTEAPIDNLNVKNSSVKKVMDPKSLSDLRAVLQSFTKNKISPTPPVKKEEVIEKIEPILTKEKPKATKIPETETFTGKEIPEDKLRQMLRVEK